MAEFIVPADKFEEEIARTAGYKELIRCKNCKKHGSEDCTLWTDAVEFETADDWFCADGDGIHGKREGE